MATVMGESLRLLVDFTELYRVRPRDVAKVALYALAAADLGHEVLVHDPDVALRKIDRTQDVGSIGKLDVTIPVEPLKQWSGEPPDVYLPTDIGIRERGLIQADWRPNTPTIVIGLRHQTKKNEERILTCVDLIATVKPSMNHPRIMSLPHVVSRGVLETLVEDGLLAAYLTDDLEAIRAKYQPEGERRLAGFVGFDGYNRHERIDRLPPWVERRWFTNKSSEGGYMEPRKYLKWLAGCKAAVDMPGQHPKTYRFPEAVMLGVPVICVPGLQSCTVPVTIANAVALRFWSDMDRLDRLMGSLDEIRTCADRCYREAWSLRAQMRLMLEWINHPGTRTPPPRTVCAIKSEGDQEKLEEELGPCDVTYTAVTEPTIMSETKAAHKVLAIIDDWGWAYHNRALALKKHAPLDWGMTIKPWRDVKWSRIVQLYDLIYLLDYAQTESARQHLSALHCKTPLVISYNADTNRRQKWWGKMCDLADYVICVNRQRWLERGGAKNCCAISNGVDLDTFRVTVPIAQRPDRVLWCGANNASGDKGYPDILVPLKRSLEASGFTTDFRLIGDRGVKRYTPDEQAAWYNSGSYILCASKSEGTANTITEGVACGCVAVSTAVGNIVEWGRSKRDCVIVPRTVQQFQRGLGMARAERIDMSRRGQEVVKRWGWKDRSRYYYAVFGKLTKGIPVKPFVYSDCKPEDI